MHRTKVGSRLLVAGLLFSAALCGAQEKPQYGGTLTIATVVPAITPLSWNPVDWSWKFQHDTGLVYEQLFAADLGKSVRRGGPHLFQTDGWVPPDAMRGELAESWQWKEDPPRVEIRLRKGVMFPDKPGVMKSRELVAQDVVDSYTRLDGSPKKVAGQLDHIRKVEATDRHTVVFTFDHYNVEWSFRFGWGFYSGIVPREVVDAGASDWKNLNGTGPFQLTDYVSANVVTFSKNPGYWDRETIGTQAYKLPFVDRIVYRIVKDEATQLTALRTAKLDVLEVIRASAVPELKRHAPQLRFKRLLSFAPRYFALRSDVRPFDDVRVRRALNMAINKQEMVSAYHHGEAELFAAPQHPDWTGHFEPLEKMPKAVQELFVYDPQKAKALLAEAGYPNGFTFKAQVCSCFPGDVDIAPLLAGYLARIGVKMEIQALEYGAYLSVMTTKTHAPGYFLSASFANPTRTLSKNFQTGSIWNPSQFSDPEFDKRLEAALRERDDSRRKILIRLLTRDALEKAPYVWLPVTYFYIGWWPWVKNYDGELFAGGYRSGPIHARMWIDHDLKKKLGY